MSHPSVTVQPASDAPDLAAAMLAWYDRHRRVLPWRAEPGRGSDPYAIWLSEIMLQQTTVATVGPYFRDFLSRWPTVADLAAADLDQVLHAWQGLGYYARARNLHACAKAVAGQHGGVFPDTEAGLLALPGIGAYTAAAIAAIAFDRPATVLDGNIERVMARLRRVEVPLPDAKPILRAHAAELTPRRRPGDYAQAVMDLGATVCTPRKPRCMLCPWERSCAAHRAGDAERLPLKRAKAARPTRHGVAFWAVRPDGAILIRKRAPEGLLGGLMEVPSTPWVEARWAATDALAHAPVTAEWRLLNGSVGHTFTHFHLELSILVGTPTDTTDAGVWVRPERLGEHALPTVVKKLVKHALAGLKPPPTP
ncbi:MAG TPA: A/G-specific adenine glycosylase [Aliidongia sp.]|uniref:A/G-specific adenine glycosylase n=1 Tax=Aliidongia sp. TaxID=1914230 RepID=UPI002DDCCC83|nr:A/G-specific adenine glycosylase [Aliidongia sp.]HEV2676598.1 A/G-specific adenine glycosylase [Aliidongia sp.]